MEKVRFSCGDHHKYFKGSSTSSNKLMMGYERENIFTSSWPQRNYRCSFCKKEFKSAQALGGHMNVHRRDRARMRLQSPDSLTPPPNPNPNFSSPSSSPTAARFLPYHMNPTTYHSQSSALSTLYGENVAHSDHCRDDEIRKKLGMMGMSKFLGVGEFEGFKVEEKNECRRAWKKSRDYFCEMDSCTGLLRDAKQDELDLELRLGWY
ncbi:hypothetical protein RJ639_035026 [Escallonia herrerae]|uniref:C2H2-type domain-containing protein n=1 Tax=Escallonia herrerae TaxID=1293975 RepID=A0AA88WV76_9ASTE|nr:hypothetical protein RJ639_035026 [Escallonia herrerae]